jgi:hypothetical protein
MSDLLNDAMRDSDSCGDSGSSLDDIAATEYSESHPHKCAGCGDRFTDEDRDAMVVLHCGCGALICYDCSNDGGCQADGCDAMAARIDAND